MDAEDFTTVKAYGVQPWLGELPNGWALGGEPLYITSESDESMAEHEWGERLQAHLDELEQLREKMQARQEQLEERVAALEAQSELVVVLMTQVADMLDEWQALRESLVAEDSADKEKGQ